MHVKLGCMTRPWGKYSSDRALEGIAKAGFRYTAFLGKHPEFQFFEYLLQPQKEIDGFKRRMESHGLKAVTAWGGNPITYGKEGMLKTAERASELGLEYVILSSPYVSRNAPVQLNEEELLAKFCDAILPTLPKLEETGLRFDVKPHMGYYGTGAGLRTLITDIGHPLLGVSYDPGNIRFYEGLDPATDLPDVADKVRSLCVKDYIGPKEAPGFPAPGEGDVDWPTLFAQLKTGGFEGYALIEGLSGETAEDVDAVALKARRDLTEWIEGAGGEVVP